MFYDCVGNYHKLRSLKQHTFIRLQVLWARDLAQFSWVFYKLQSKDLAVILISLGKGLIPAHLYCWMTSFLTVVRFMVVCFIKCYGTNLLARHDIIMEVTSHQFFHNPFLRNKSHILSALKGKGIIKCIPQR